MSQKVEIYYGSQTGNSFELAQRIEFMIRRETELQVDLSPIDEFDFQHADLFIFCVSTTGQGDPPDDSKAFWNRLMSKDLTINFTANIMFFAMGDSSYPKFNWVGLSMARRLESLGACLIDEVILCDERHELGYDFHADKGIVNLRRFLDDEFNVTFNTDKKYLIKCPVKISKSAKVTTFEPDHIIKSTVLSNERVTAVKHFQETRLVRFAYTDNKYEAGDVVNIHPLNHPDYVEMAFEATGWDPEWIIEGDRDFLPTTLHTLFTRHFDLIGIPKRHFFAILALYSTHELEKERLEEFASSDGTDERWDYANRPRRTLSEALMDFPHTVKAFPINALFELFPMIRPRPYSICSYSHDHIEILCAVVKYRSRMVKPRIGICSNYIKRLEVGDEVRLHVTKGTFRLPPTGDLIMIGPGTGCAPFRSIIQQRQQHQPKIDQSSSLLVFGCRHPSMDLYFETEFDDVLKRLNAFSRVEKKQQYVQDVVKENGELVVNLIMNGAVVLIAGKAQNMPDQVKEALVDCFVNAGFDVDSGNQLLTMLEEQGRLQQETW